MKMINKLCGLKDEFYTECDDSYLAEELKIRTKELIGERLKIFQ